MSPSRLLTALSIYAVLMLLTVFTLTGKIQLATIILLAGLAVKTYIGYLANRDH